VGYQFDWSVVFSHGTGEVVLAGLEYTLLVSALSLALGTVVGMVVALARLTRRFPVAQLAYIYTDFFRTTPILVQIVWIFYVLPILTGVNLSAVDSGVLALGLNSGAFFSEIFRAGIESIGQGQRDAASVLGLSHIATLRHIILPQALRRVMAPTGNLFISLVKDSSILSVIGVTELLYQFQSQASVTFRPIELYTALAVVYFLVTYPMSLGISALERRFPMSVS
jgi:polar amino acid transport system permease protein